MVIYGDPTVCPACRARLAGNQACPSCGLELQSPEAAELWQLFVQADQLIARAPRRQATPQATPVQPQATAMPMPTVPPPAIKPSRSWSMGTVLLALGALCLLVAGAIFLTVTWGSMNNVQRALVMLVVTIAFGLGAKWTTQRGLVASSESLWAVFLGLATLDIFYAYAVSLFGVGDLPLALLACIWTVAFIALAVALPVHLWVPSLVAGLSGSVAPWLVLESLPRDWEPFWYISVAIVVLALVVAALLAGGRSRGAWLPGIVGAGALIAWAGVAAGQVYESAPEVTVRDALPTLIVAACCLAVASLAITLRPWAVAAALIVLGNLACALASQPEVVLAVLTPTLALVGLGAGGWGRGFRFASVVAFGVLGMAGALALAEASSAGDGVWWLPLVCVAGGALALGVVSRWPEPALENQRLHVIASALALAGIGGCLALIPVAENFGHSYLAIAPVLAVVTALLYRKWAAWGWWFVPVLIVALELTLSWGEPGRIAAGAAGLVLITVVTSVRPPWPGATAAGFSATMVGVSVAVFLDAESTLELPTQGVVVVAIAVAFLLMAMAADEWPIHRVGFEIGTAALAAIALVIQTESLGHLALSFTVIGVALVIVALLEDGWRSRLRWLGAACLAVAWVLRLIDTDVTVVEAYTAPFAIVALTAGLWAMHENPERASMPTLSAGLSLALVPSIPQALDDPISWRAVALGVLAAVILAWGMQSRWRAPFLFGGVVLALVVIRELWPTASGLPRWVLIAVAGTLLMGIGLTWEKWIAEGRAALVRLSHMR
jgi:hypothetical protein